ncbi:MAG: hypothetical protein NVS3B20_08940 [Polyangiales bacterium]
MVFGAAWAILAIATLATLATMMQSVDAYGAQNDASEPPTTLRVPPKIRSIRFDVSPGGAAITHNLVFEKGALAVSPSTASDPALYFAFTAQARPLAIEAKRFALDEAGHPIDQGESVVIAEAITRPPWAAIILGAENAAGHVIRVPHRSGDGPFSLRVRSAISTFAAGSKEVSLLARLGVRGGAPLTVERIEVGAILGAAIRGARGVFCGASGESLPLTISFPDYPLTKTNANTGTTPPAVAARGVDDDLCVDVLL